MSAALTIFSLAWRVASLFIPRPPIKQGKLADRKTQAASYGQVIPYVEGTVRAAGNILWEPHKGLIQKSREQKGGKSGLGQSVIFYEYFWTVEIGLCEGPISTVRRIWANGKLIYDARVGSKIMKKYGKMKIRIYKGLEDDLPDPLIEAEEGAGNAPAGRGLARLFLELLPLTNDFGNIRPNIEAEIVRSHTPAHYATNITTGFKTPLFTGQFTVDPERLAAYYRGSYLSEGIITKFDFLAEKAVLDTAGQGWLASSWAIDVDNDGFIYCTRGGIATSEIAKLDPVTLQILNSQPFFPGPPISGLATIMLRVDRVGKQVIWISGRPQGSGQTGHLWCFDFLSLGFRFLFDPSAYGFPYIDRITVDADGNAWCTANQYLLRVTPGGVPTGFDLSAYNIASGPLFWDDETDSIIISTTGGGILKFDIASESVVGTLANVGTWTHNMRPWGGTFWSINGFRLWEIDIVNMQIVRGIGYVPATGDEIQNSPGAFLGDPVYLPTLHALQVSVSGGSGGVSIIYLDRVVPGSVLLKDIVIGVSEHTRRLAAADLGVGELLDVVKGFIASRQTAAREWINDLMQGYFFAGRNDGERIDFPKLGGAIVASIDEDELAAHEPDEEMPDLITFPINQETEVPRDFGVQYFDYDKDYETNVQHAPRGQTDSEQKAALELPVVLTADEAAQIAEVNLYMQLNQREQREIHLTAKYFTLDPADPIEVTITSL